MLICNKELTDLTIHTSYFMSIIDIVSGINLNDSNFQWNPVKTTRQKNCDLLISVSLMNVWIIDCGLISVRITADLKLREWDNVQDD